RPMLRALPCAPAVATAEKRAAVARMTRVCRGREAAVPTTRRRPQRCPAEHGPILPTARSYPPLYPFARPRPLRRCPALASAAVQAQAARALALLHRDQPRVRTIRGAKLLVRAALHHPSALEHDDLVAIPNRAQTVRHDQAGRPAPPHVVGDPQLRHRIERARRFVEDQ